MQKKYLKNITGKEDTGFQDFFSSNTFGNDCKR